MAPARHRPETVNAVTARLDKISTAIAGVSGKQFTVSSAGDRLVVAQERGRVTDRLFTIRKIDDGEYILQEAGKTDRDWAIDSGPLDKICETMEDQILHVCLEAHERRAVKNEGDPDVRAWREEELSALEVMTKDPGESRNEIDELERMFAAPNPPKP